MNFIGINIHGVTYHIIYLHFILVIKYCCETHVMNILCIHYLLYLLLGMEG